jgi:hypothetical protein
MFIINNFKKRKKETHQIHPKDPPHPNHLIPTRKRAKRKNLKNLTKNHQSKLSFKNFLVMARNRDLKIVFLKCFIQDFVFQNQS